MAEPDPKPSKTSPVETSWLVEDDWPEIVPVTQAEVEVIERFLGDLLDELLGGARGSK